jgi:hypothetical protein
VPFFTIDARSRLSIPGHPLALQPSVSNESGKENKVPGR